MSNAIESGNLVVTETDRESTKKNKTTKVISRRRAHIKRVDRENADFLSSMFFQSSLFGTLSLIVYFVWIQFPGEVDSQCAVRRNLAAEVQPPRVWKVSDLSAAEAAMILAKGSSDDGTAVAVTNYRLPPPRRARVSVSLAEDFPGKRENLQLGYDIKWGLKCPDFPAESTATTAAVVAPESKNEGGRLECKFEPDIPSDLRKIYKTWLATNVSARTTRFPEADFGWIPCESGVYTDNSVTIKIEKMQRPASEIIPKPAGTVAKTADVSADVREAVAENHAAKKISGTDSVYSVACDEISGISELSHEDILQRYLGIVSSDVFKAEWDREDGRKVLRLTSLNSTDSEPYTFKFDRTSNSPVIYNPLDGSIARTAQCLNVPMRDALNRLNKQSGLSRVSATHSCVTDPKDIKVDYSWKYTPTHAASDVNRECHQHGLFFHQWKATVYDKTATSTVIVKVQDTTGPVVDPSLGSEQARSVCFGPNPATSNNSPASQVCLRDQLIAAARTAYFDNCFEQSDISVSMDLKNALWLSCDRTGDSCHPVTHETLAEMGIFYDKTANDVCARWKTLTTSPPREAPSSFLRVEARVASATDPCGNEAATKIRIVGLFIDRARPALADAYRKMCSH